MSLAKQALLRLGHPACQICQGLCSPRTATIEIQRAAQGSLTVEMFVHICAQSSCHDSAIGRHLWTDGTVSLSPSLLTIGVITKVQK